MCAGPALPPWATHTLAGVRAACALFGLGICNATGQLDATIAQVHAQAHARWQFNHTREGWIDALFASSYRAEGATYAALTASGAAPRMVAAEEGLGESELRSLRDGTR